MALEGQGKLIAGDGAAIVADPDDPQPSLCDLDANLGSAGVQGVLYQLLHRGGGSLYDLAGRDLGH